MPTPPWDDLASFLDTEDFAILATQENGATFPVILEEQYLSHESGTWDMNTASPWAIARETDTAGLKKYTRLNIGGVSFWLVHDPQPDGTGMATLPLSRSATLS